MICAVYIPPELSSYSSQEDTWDILYSEALKYKRLYKDYKCIFFGYFSAYPSETSEKWIDPLQAEEEDDV